MGSLPDDAGTGSVKRLHLTLGSTYVPLFIVDAQIE